MPEAGSDRTTLNAPASSHGSKAARWAQQCQGFNHELKEISQPVFGEGCCFNAAIFKLLVLEIILMWLSHGTVWNACMKALLFISSETGGHPPVLLLCFRSATVLQVKIHYQEKF